MEKQVGGRRRMLRREESHPCLGLENILSPNESQDTK